MRYFLLSNFDRIYRDVRRPETVPSVSDRLSRPRSSIDRSHADARDDLENDPTDRRREQGSPTPDLNNVTVICRAVRAVQSN